MKDIGNELKEKREEIGITIKEVATDLDVDDIIVENIEAGNNKVFKDVLDLKDFIGRYARYLGLDADKIVDDVNDYLFNETSKISLDDIKKASISDTSDDKKIKSPYTLEVKEKSSKKILIAIIIIVIIVLLICYFLLKNLFIS